MFKKEQAVPGTMIQFNEQLVCILPAMFRGDKSKELVDFVKGYIKPGDTGTGWINILPNTIATVIKAPKRYKEAGMNILIDIQGHQFYCFWCDVYHNVKVI